MLGLRRGLLQPGGLIHSRFTLQTLYSSLTASRLPLRLLPTTSYLPTRKYSKPRKTYFIPPSRRPLPVPSKSEGIYPEVQDALRSADVSTQLRVIMRHMVHPVVILTSSTSAKSSDWRAITLSSFCSLSLKPHPLITLNIKMPSTCAHTIHTRQRFIIHAMLPTSRAADFAARFSQPYVPGEDWKYKERLNSIETPVVIGKSKSSQDDEATFFEDPDPIQEHQDPPTLLKDGQFGRVPVCANESTDNLPSIQEEVMFRLYCTPTKNIPVQDHEIWVAKVDRIEYPDHGNKPFGLEPYAPLSLLYGDRHFRETGLHMVDEHVKVRRWMRRKMLWEVERREEKKQKWDRRVQMSRRRNNLLGMKRDFHDGLLELDDGDELGREPELEGDEQDVGSSDEWYSVMKKRAGLKKMLPTMPPEIIPDIPHPNSSHNPYPPHDTDNFHDTDKSHSSGNFHGTDKSHSPGKFRGTDKPRRPGTFRDSDVPRNSDSSRRLPINSLTSTREPVPPAQNSSSGESQAMSAKTSVVGKVPKKPAVRSLEDWMRKRPSNGSGLSSNSPQTAQVSFLATKPKWPSSAPMPPQSTTTLKSPSALPSQSSSIFQQQTRTLTSRATSHTRPVHPTQFHKASESPFTRNPPLNKETQLTRSAEWSKPPQSDNLNGTHKHSKFFLSSNSFARPNNNMTSSSGSDMDFTSQSITLSRPDDGFSRPVQPIKLPYSAKPSQLDSMTNSPKQNEGLTRSPQSVRLLRSDDGFSRPAQPSRMSWSDNSFAKPSQPDSITSFPKPNDGATRSPQSVRLLRSDDGFSRPAQPSRMSWSDNSFARPSQSDSITSFPKSNDGATSSPQSVRLLRSDDGFSRSTQSTRIPQSGDGFARPSHPDDMTSFSKLNKDPTHSPQLFRSDDGFARPTQSIRISQSGDGYARPSQFSRQSQRDDCFTRPSQSNITSKNDDSYARSYQSRELSRYGNGFSTPTQSNRTAPLNRHSQFTRPSQFDGSPRPSSFGRPSQSGHGMMNKHSQFNKAPPNKVASPSKRPRNEKPSGPFTDSLLPLEPLGPITQTLPPLDPEVDPEWELFNDPDILWGARKHEAPELKLPSKYWFRRVLAAPKLLRPVSVLPVPDKPERRDLESIEEVKGRKNRDTSSIEKDEEGKEMDEGDDKKRNIGKAELNNTERKDEIEQNRDAKGNIKEKDISEPQLQSQPLRDTQGVDDSWRLIPRINLSEKLGTKQPQPQPQPQPQNEQVHHSFGVEKIYQLQPQEQPPKKWVDMSKENPTLGKGKETAQSSPSQPQRQPQTKLDDMNTEKLVLEERRYQSQSQPPRHLQRKVEDTEGDMQGTEGMSYTPLKRQGKVTLSSTGKVLENWKVKVMRKMQKKHNPGRPWEVRGGQTRRKK